MNHVPATDKRRPKVVEWLQEYSIPLISGVVVALVLANIAPNFYRSIVWDSPLDFLQGTHTTESTPAAELLHHRTADNHEAGHTVAKVVSHHTQGNTASTADQLGEETDAAVTTPTVTHEATDPGQHEASHAGGLTHLLDHIFTMHFLVNDIFMVFFFGIAAKEITEACLPNGALNPVSKAINPLCATVGGVLGPVAVFLGLNACIGQPVWLNGWGIPTATDIALAWLVAKLIFGKGHPAISFLLLLAVADDAIGLGIIAVAYPDPAHPTEWLNALWIVPGMIVAFALRKKHVQTWIPYVAVGGAFAWWGLYSAHLHPALALVFIVPFMPGPKQDFGLFVDEVEGGGSSGVPEHVVHGHSPLETFEHQLRLFVDGGLFFFALANAGVSFGQVTALTWIVVLSLLVGKTIGVTLFSWVANAVGFRLPDGMSLRHLIVTGSIAGLGLTVALFVSGQAFADPNTQGAAKMGALFSAGAAATSFALAQALGVSNVKVDSLRRGWNVLLHALTARDQRAGG
ncbi:MAG: Na+/H+ antiporter NhaA [Planctomycetales bacterium]|nr:Na+/H+ antiporter NhaA [Planctomycetales bacterium]